MAERLGQRALQECKGHCEAPSACVLLPDGSEHPLLSISLKSQAERRVRNDGGRWGRRRWGKHYSGPLLSFESLSTALHPKGVCAEGGGSWQNRV